MVKTLQDIKINIIGGVIASIIPASCHEAKDHGTCTVCLLILHWHIQTCFESDKSLVWHGGKTKTRIYLWFTLEVFAKPSHLMQFLIKRAVSAQKSISRGEPLFFLISIHWTPPPWRSLGWKMIWLEFYFCYYYYYYLFIFMSWVISARISLTFLSLIYDWSYMAKVLIKTTRTDVK